MLPLSTKLTRRLIGAVSIVALAVILFSVFFSGRDEAAHYADSNLEIPAKPPQPEFSMPGQTITTTAAEHAIAESRSGQENSLVTNERPQPPQLAVSAEAITPESESTMPAERPQPPAPVQKQSAQSTLPADGQWIIQLASFSKPDNAAQLQQKLKKMGFTAYTLQAKSGDKVINRVYVGPFLAKTKAETTLSQLQQKTQLKGIIQDYNPAKLAA